MSRSRGEAKSNLAKWNLIGGIQFKHVKGCLIFIAVQWLGMFWLDVGRFRGHVLYPVRIVEMERGTSSKEGCCELLLAYAARCCSPRLEFEILCKLLNYKGLWPSREPRRLRSRFIVIWKVRIICIIFKLKRVFSPLFTRQTTYICTCHENVLSPITTYPTLH